MYALRLDQETPDEQLIPAVLGGSHAAFAVLVERYQDRVYRLLSRYVRDPVECEDLSQDVFLKVFKKLHTFQGDSQFFTWLFRIAVNTATDHLARASRRRLRLVEDDAELDARAGDRTSAPPLQPLLQSELAAVTRKLVDELPEKFRTILILREFEDLSYNEIAAVLQCQLGTVESRLFRARQRFKDLLERTHPDLIDGREPAAAAPGPTDRRGNR